MNREKHFHPLAALHLLRKTLLVYLLPLVQVLFDRNWDACARRCGRTLYCSSLSAPCAGLCTMAAAGRWMPRARCTSAGGLACGWTAPCAPRGWRR